MGRGSEGGGEGARGEFAVGEDGEEFADIDSGARVELAGASDLGHHPLRLNPQVAVVDEDLESFFRC